MIVCNKCKEKADHGDISLWGEKHYSNANTGFRAPIGSGHLCEPCYKAYKAALAGVARNFGFDLSKEEA